MLMKILLIIYHCEVGTVKPYQLVKPVPVTLVAVRNLIQQNELPRLPVPPLRQTCELYLRALEPVVEPDELKRTKDLVEEFQRAGGVGERLQRSLEQRADCTDNWLTEWYVKAFYMDLRKPLVIFSNAALILSPVTDRDTDLGQTRCAAKVISGNLDVKALIDSGTLPVEYMGGKQLCMKQCEQLMSACQVPGLKSDSLVFYSKSTTPPKHITVVHNFQFFKLDVYDSDGTRLTVDQLCVQLDRIRNSSKQSDVEPVGILTTQNRDTWSKTYSNLIKDETNRQSVSTIESSIFTVCLDGAMPPVSNDKYHQMLHGGGSQWNSGNRWFDKSMQVICGEDGTCGLNQSHAVIDGTSKMAFINQLVKIMKNPEVIQSPSEPLPMPQKLHFNITPEIQKDIDEAKQRVDILTQNLDLSVSVFKHFGKDVLKALKLSPDAFVQMAIQLAYYRIHHQCCPTEEPVSLRRFKLGRLTAINSNTRTSVAFVKAFDDPQKQNSERVHLMKKALEEHVWNAKKASRGQAITTHLFMLKALAAEENISIPGIFTDSSFFKVFDYKLVTSQVTSKVGCTSFMASEDFNAYSMCYSTFNEQFNFTVFYLHGSKTCTNNKAANLLRAVEDAMLDMRTLLENNITLECF
ncbi:carnitine O-acetyltransferase-like [Antennarius striatus]|uniref:carnitine O-acetyltransferase-like n=1 Tax=Antennarius striatus TaxID=241820 RepID=UPI0035AE1903